MHFTCDAAALAGALADVHHAVSNKPPLPILGCARFTQHKGHLRIDATDLSLTLSRTLPLQGTSGPASSENGACETPSSRSEGVAVPVERLLATLKDLPAQPVRFEQTDAAAVRLSTDQGTYELEAYSGADFPTLAAPSGTALALPEGLVKAVGELTHATARDALRAALCSVLLEMHPAESIAVATDGHRLVRLVAPPLVSPSAAADGEAPRGEVTLLLPREALDVLSRLVGSGAATLYRTDEHAHVVFGTPEARGRCSVRLPEAPFPNWRAVIPDGATRTVITERETLRGAVRRVGRFADPVTRQVRLTIGEGRVEVAADDAQRAGKAAEHVPAETRGESLVIGFQSHYLEETLRRLPGEEVSIRLVSATRPALFAPIVPENAPEPAFRLLSLVMPSILQEAYAKKNPAVSVAAA